MATRYFCDRCKCEVKPPAGLTLVSLATKLNVTTVESKFELCFACQNDFVNNFMIPPPIER